MAETTKRIDLSIALTLTGANARRFEDAAKKRGIDPAFLVADMIETCSRDDLFDAILDDAERVNG